MALPQTPGISIKYSITVKGETDRDERGRETNGGGKESNQCIHMIRFGLEFQILLFRTRKLNP